MSSARIVFVFSFLFLPFFSEAFTLTVRGVSNVVTQDPATPKKIEVNAGYALPSACSVRDGTTPCNSCVGNNIEVPGTSAGETVPAPCNENSVYDELTFSATVESDSAEINTLPVGVSSAVEYSANKITGFTAPVVNGKSYSISATWAQMSAMPGLAFPLTCSTSTNCGSTKTLYFGPIKDDKFVESVSVTINYSFINYTSQSTPLNGYTKALAKMCKPSTMVPLVSPHSSEGLCFFEMYPGDTKAYVTNLINGWEATPIDPDTQFKYTHVVMFYNEKTGADTTLTTLKTIKNNSPKALLGITTTAGDPLTDYKVGALENSTADVTRTYCFLPAMQDQTGNIIYFLDIQKFISAEDLSNEERDRMCASPSEVVGVLSDKDCFIATVAFASRYHPFLDVLREFRNKFLHPYSWGKKFIKFYYQSGPAWAKFIGDHFWLKSIVKIVLLPVIALAYLMLNPLWILLLLSIGVLVLAWNKVRRQA